MPVYSTSWGRFPKNNTVYLATTPKAFPTAMIVGTAKVGVYFLVKLAKQKFTQRIKIINNDAQDQAIVAIVNKHPLLPHLKTLASQFFAGAVDIKGPLDINQLHNLFVVKSDMAISNFNRMMGLDGESTDRGAPVKPTFKPTRKFGKAAVYMPENMQPSRQKNIIDILTKSKAVLATKGFDWLITTGNIKITNLKPPMIGHYTIGTDDIAIDSRGGTLEVAVNVVLHELAHKLYFRSMNAKEHALIKKIYDGEIKTPQQVDWDRIRKITTQYIGKDARYKKAGMFVFTEITDNPAKNGWWAVNAEIVKGKLVFPQKIPAFGPMKPQDIEKHFAVPKTLHKWFPTQYSRKNAEEFFAELFAEWLEGKLEKLPAAWIDRVTKPYQK